MFRPIRTPRLELVPASLAHVNAELQGHDALSTLLSAEVPASWPPGEYDRDALEFFQRRLQASPQDAGWYAWYVSATSSTGSRLLVAAAGFMGPPSEGTVEIGYSVIPEVCGNGYAREIVAALVEHAFAFGAVQRVIAHTRQANVASAAVLVRCGFLPAGAGCEAGTSRYERARCEPHKLSL